VSGLSSFAFFLNLAAGHEEIAYYFLWYFILSHSV